MCDKNIHKELQSNGTMICCFCDKKLQNYTKSIPDLCCENKRCLYLL